MVSDSMLCSKGKQTKGGNKHYTSVPGATQALGFTSYVSARPNDIYRKPKDLYAEVVQASRFLKDPEEPPMPYAPHPATHGIMEPYEFTSLDPQCWTKTVGIDHCLVFASFDG